MRTTLGGLLDRIAKGAYENAVTLHRKEQERLAHGAPPAAHVMETSAGLKKRTASRSRELSLGLSLTSRTN